MKKNADVGAQLVKSLTFEVEAIPQDNAIQVKNTENMTPLNVKVRVRKKNDGTSFVRKGVIAVPRIDLPDTPIERLRLASSDHTIMSFNMLMEADLEKKVTKKSKRSFFGICLGVQGDDDIDDVQYLPSASNIGKDSRSDSGVVKLKNMRPVAKTAVTETSSTFTSRQKDKIFGKCKPGGCLDPPFGEDKYAYGPQPLHHLTRMDISSELDLQEPSDKIFLKNKIVEVIDSKIKYDQDDNVDKSILNLYQGEAKTKVEENDSEFIITYPPGLSSSGLLMANERNEKNVVRRTSGARHSRKSFNEFSTEYFSPPRPPRDSKDSQKDKGKQPYTKEILSPTQATDKLLLPAGFLQTIEKYDSKDNVISGTEIYPQKSILTTSSHGMTSEILGDLERKPDRNTWNSPGTPELASVGVADTGLVGLGFALGTRKDIDKSTELGTVPSKGETLDGIYTNGILPDNSLLQKSPKTTPLQDITSKAWDNAATAGLAGVGSTTIGLVGLGIALSTNEDNNEPTDHKEITSQISKGTSTRDSYNMEHSNLGSAATEYSGRTATSDMDMNINRGLLPIRRAIITGSDEILERNTNIPSQERVIPDAGLIRGISPMEHVSHGDTERDLVFHGVDMVEGSERRISQVGNTFLNRPIHDDTYRDLVPTGMTTTDGSERGFLRTGRLTNESVDGELPSIGMDVIGDSERGFTPMGQPINDSTNRHILLGRRTTGSEGTFSHTGKAFHETNESGVVPRVIPITERPEESPQLMERGTYEEATDFSISGSETGNLPVDSAVNQETLSEHGTERTSSSIRRAIMSAGLDRNLKSRENTVVGGSDRDISPIGVDESILKHKEPERIFPFIEKNITQAYEITREMDINERSDLDFTPSEIGKTANNHDTARNTDVIKSFQPALQFSGGISSSAIIPSIAKYEKNLEKDNISGNRFLKTTTTHSEKEVSQVGKYSGAERDILPISKLAGNYQKGVLSVKASSTDDHTAERPKKHDASVISDILNSPSDIILQYRDNKPLAKSPVAGVDIKPTDDILEQAGRTLDDWQNKDGQIATSIGISSHDSKGSTQKYGRRVSRESIFLNLAFQAYQDDNQTAIKSLDSTKVQDPSKIVLVKSLLRSHDKSGISVPIDSKHIMNIAIRSASVIQERKSRIPKPISKFDSGKSDYSNSTISFKEIGNDPHAALSMVFHQELVPLESIIKSLKEDIDSLAAQQMMLTDRLGTQRIRPVYNRKCGCLKRISTLRTE